MHWHSSWCRLVFLVFFKGETVCPHTFWKLVSVEFLSVLWVHRQIKYIDAFVEVTVNFKIYSFYFGELKVACFEILSLCDFSHCFKLLLHFVLSTSFHETWLNIPVVLIQHKFIIVLGF